MNSNNNINFKKAFEKTKILFSTENKIATFWNTTFKYFILSELTFNQTIIRTGQIECVKPTIITPDNLIKNFNGFEKEDIEFINQFFHKNISKLLLLGYQFSNKISNIETIDTPFFDIYKNIKKEIKTNENIVILTAPDDIWSLAITKCSMDIILKSVNQNILDLKEKGYFMDNLSKIKQEIEFLFLDIETSTNKKETILKLGKYLTDNNLFSQYEERFFNIYKNI